MKKFNSFCSALSIVAIMTLLGITSAYADSGILGCKGYQSEGRQTIYDLSNFNDDRAINITKILAYDGDGNLLCYYPTDSLPGFNPVLGPNQSTSFNSTDMAGCHNVTTWPPANGRLIVKIYWSASGLKGLALYGGSITFANGDGAHSRLDCQPLKLGPLKWER